MSEKKPSPLNWILWWRIDPAELTRQIQNYSTLPIYQSARGISFLLLLFSAVVTALLVMALQWSAASYFGAAVSVLIGIVVFLGYRWAIVAAMLAWTLEKGYELVVSAQSGAYVNLVIVIVWWAVFMHAFYLAHRVEEARRTAGGSDPAGPPETRP